MAALFQSDTRLTRDATLFNVANSTKATFAFWFKVEDGQGGVVFFGGPSAFARFQVSVLSSNGGVSLIMRNSSGTILYNTRTTDAYDDDAWHHAVISVDLSVPTVTWRVDREDPDLTVTTAATAGTIDFEGCTQWKVGQSFNNTGTQYQGAIYDLLFKAGEYVDITDADELRKFVSSDGLTEAQADQFRQNVGPNSGQKPVGYGVNCSIFNGAPADIYFSNDFQQNKGPTGAFVLSSTFDEETNPRVYRSAAHYDNKERWFESELTGFSYTRSRTFIEQREGHPKRGLRMGIDEMDEPFRQERPSDSYHNLLFNDREDDTEEYDR